MPSPSTAFIHLDRIGDQLLLLPAFQELARNSSITLVTRPEYASQLAGIPWLGVESIDVAPSDWKTAQRHAEKLADRVILTQLAHVRAPRHESSFALELWRRTGLPADLFHSLPLELPNRSIKAEAAIIDAAGVDGRTLILVNTVGMSSPFDLGPSFQAWLSASFGGSCQIVDIGQIAAPRIIDLLGLYERAAVLISIDTATLHLGYASRTPTIALLADHPWNASPSRAHWKLAVRYSAVPGRLGEIRAAIESLTGFVAVPVNVDLKPTLSPAVLEFIYAAEGDTSGRVGRRQAICVTCSDSVTVGGVARECQRCGCNLLLKQSNLNERCPAGKW